MDGTSNPGTEHVQSWLKKLKESQDRKKDEKIRKYNDVVSKLIILLIGVCIVCVIVIAALIVQNESQKKAMDSLVLANNSTFNNQQVQMQTLQGQIQSLQAQNERYQSFYPVEPDAGRRPPGQCRPELSQRDTNRLR